MTETLKIPEGGEVVESNWKDDIDLDYETFGTNQQEMEYVSPTEVDEQSIERIKAINLKLRDRGRKTMSLLAS